MARAADVPKTAPPTTSVELEEQHRYSIKTQALFGAAGGIAAIAGIALLADSYLRYSVLEGGGDGHSCRPCTASEVAVPRVELGLGIGFLVVGAGLLITSGALAGLDHRWQRDHVYKVSRAVQVDAGGVHF